jgi:hypothetical protein
MLRGVGPLLIGIVLWVTFILHPPARLLVIEDVLVLIVAGYALWGASTTFVPTLQSVDVLPTGITLRFPSGVGQTTVWASLNSKVKVVDYRFSGNTFAHVPFTLVYRRQSHGISPEAALALVTSARESGLAVREAVRESPVGQTRSWSIQPISPPRSKPG